MRKKLLIVTLCLLILCNIQRAPAFENESSRGKGGEAGGTENTATLSINGTKFEDSNKNAIFDGNERGFSGWVVRLKLEGRDVSSTTTNESGFYSFTNPAPGNYTVTKDRQAGWVQSFPGSGYYDIYLIDKNAYGYNFGNFRISRAPISNSSAAVRPFKASDDSDDYSPLEIEDRIRPMPRPGPYPDPMNGDS